MRICRNCKIIIAADVLTVSHFICDILYAYILKNYAYIINERYIYYILHIYFTSNLFRSVLHRRYFNNLF